MSKTSLVSKLLFGKKVAFVRYKTWLLKKEAFATNLFGEDQSSTLAISAEPAPLMSSACSCPLQILNGHHDDDGAEMVMLNAMIVLVMRMRRVKMMRMVIFLSS